MTTITDQLAEALRILTGQVKPYEDGDGAAMYHAQNIAREALAAYDAQRERHPDTEAFMNAADGALNSDYYQVTDELIDRVDDGAWVTVRMFVTNEEAGLSTGEED